MITIERITIASKYLDSLGKCLNESELPANNRVRASAPCYLIAMQHHHAIVRLIDGTLYASAFAMSRVMFDAYIRGLWFNLCADDNQCMKFLENWEPPGTSKMIRDIDSPKFNQHIFSTGITEIKQQSWETMCTYTHTGGLQVQRWFTSESIEPNYPSEEIEEILKFAELIGLFSAFDFAKLTNNEQLCNQVIKIKEEYDISLSNLLSK